MNYLYDAFGLKMLNGWIWSVSKDIANDLFHISKKNRKKNRKHEAQHMVRY